MYLSWSLVVVLSIVVVYFLDVNRKLKKLNQECRQELVRLRQVESRARRVLL